jgi:carbonic anhydrase/acetyltransferase-like protein (isoleucine patch superfamily)
MPPIILPYRNILPKIDPRTFVAPGAVIIGDVEIGPDSSIWFG